MANWLADRHELAPRLTDAVAKRIASTELHDAALRDIGGFVHRTIVEDEHAYAVRIDDGALLDAAEQITHARQHLDPEAQPQVGGILGCKPERLDAELDTLAARARTRAVKIPITSEVRDRARNGRYAFVHDRGPDFAAGVWVIDPAFMLDLAHDQLNESDSTLPARTRTSPARASTMRSSTTRPPRTRRRAQARAAKRRRHAPTLGSDTTSAPD